MGGGGTVYLPLLDVLDGAPVTLGLTPVLCDQLETLPGDAGRRLPALPARRPRADPRRGRARARRAAASRSSPPRCAARRATTRAPSGRSRSAGATCSGALRRARAGGALDLRGHPRRAAAAGHRRRAAAAAGHRHRRRTSAASAAWAAASGCPSAPTSRASSATSPSTACGRSAWTRRASHGLGAPEQLEPVLTEAGPVAVPIDWQTVELVWNDARGYPPHAVYRDYHRAHGARPQALEQRRRRLRPRRRRSPARASTPRDFVGADAAATATTRAGGRAALLRARHRAARPLVVRGPGVARGVVAEARDAGLELVTVLGGRSSAWSRSSGALAASTWGSGKDLSTWDSPRGRRARLRRAHGRAADRRARPPRGAEPRAALERAARELLALQSSDWAFMVTRELAGRLSAASASSGHARAHDAALAALTDSAPRAGPHAAQPRARPRPRLADRPLMRALILSWEYPPLIEGGLARHVRKLAENLAARASRCTCSRAGARSRPPRRRWAA